ncbi:MAG: hypothetical protein BHW25_02615 [Faecalibacterium sp. CAG:82-related_59_9]|nr:MAG: hypothetical protein BHW25_02615 [Faecalibacterium sp. CAG:82-related_59_9]
MEKHVSAVLVAAGSSTRMGFDKLSFDLGGETVLGRSIRAFEESPLVSEIVLVAGKNREYVEAQAAACTKPVQVVQGGATRAESAKNGVLAAHGELVAVHDAARLVNLHMFPHRHILHIHKAGHPGRWQKSPGEMCGGDDPGPQYPVCGADAPVL